MNLLIAGDLTLQERVARAKWDIQKLQQAFDGVRGLSAGCDYSIVNFESPVTDCTAFIAKDGPMLKNPSTVFDIIKFCGFNDVTIANNHLKDYKCQGVMDMIHRYKGHNILPIGAGSNIKEARKPVILREDGGISEGINVCEYESSITASTEAGVNPLDLTHLYYDIRAIKDNVDKVVVIIHGGREHYQLPTSRMKRE